MQNATTSNEAVTQAITGLRTEMKNLNKNRGKWRRRSLAALVVALVSAGIAVAAITTTTNSFSAMKGDVFVYDESTISIVSKGMFAQDATLVAAGTVQGSPIEADVALATANTAIAAGDWFYQIEVKEASVAILVSGTLKIELFEDGVSKGALYMGQASADAAAVEGVTAKWSLGSSLQSNAAYVVKVTQA